MQEQRFVELVDGEWRVGVELAVALFPGGARCTHECAGTVEFGDQAVNRLGQLRTSSSSTFASGSSVRTSKMEIMGSRRMNAKNRNRNRPMVPMYVAQSQRVAW